MRKIKFELEEESRANKVFLVLEYMSGDADAYVTEEVELDDITFDNYKDNFEIIQREFDFYSILKEILDVNSGKNKYNTYDKVKEQYGEEMAHAFDQVPGDSTVDGQFPCSLSDIELIAYDSIGNKYKSYL